MKDTETLILEELREFRKEYQEDKKKQLEINNMVIRNEEKIKGIWKIPVVSTFILSVISGIGIFLGRMK
jgi:hypothetical protein